MVLVSSAFCVVLKRISREITDTFYHFGPKVMHKISPTLHWLEFSHWSILTVNKTGKQSLALLPKNKKKNKQISE